MRQKRSFLSLKTKGSETLKNLVSQTLGKTRFDFVTFLAAARELDIRAQCSMWNYGLNAVIQAVRQSYCSPNTCTKSLHGLHPNAMVQGKSDPNYKIAAENRRARFDYAIEDDLECGIILEGSEVKSLRIGGANIAESYAAVEDGELWLVNSYIAPYKQAKTFGHEERRRRKLLVSRKQLSNLWNDTQRKGMTLVPLVLYFNHKGMAKIKIGIAKGKKLHDKRDTSAKRDWGRQKQRLLKQG